MNRLPAFVALLAPFADRGSLHHWQLHGPAVVCAVVDEQVPAHSPRPVENWRKPSLGLGLGGWHQQLLRQLQRCRVQRVGTHTAQVCLLLLCADALHLPVPWLAVALESPLHLNGAVPRDALGLLLGALCACSQFHESGGCVGLSLIGRSISRHRRVVASRLLLRVRVPLSRQPLLRWSVQGAGLHALFASCSEQSFFVLNRRSHSISFTRAQGQGIPSTR